MHGFLRGGREKGCFFNSNFTLAFCERGLMKSLKVKEINAVWNMRRVLITSLPHALLES